MFMMMSYNMHLNVERFRKSHRTLSTLKLFVFVVQKFLFHKFFNIQIKNIRYDYRCLMMHCNEFEGMRKSENKITLCSTGNCINQIIYNEHDCNIRHAEKSETRSLHVTIHYKYWFQRTGHDHVNNWLQTAYFSKNI